MLLAVAIVLLFLIYVLALYGGSHPNGALLYSPSTRPGIFLAMLGMLNYVLILVSVSAFILIPVGLVIGIRKLMCS